jgi:type I restriction enzyme S subunit
MNLVGPPLGKTALIPDNFPEANINQAITLYRIVDPDLRDFFFEYIRSDLAQTWLERRSKKTSGQQNLTLELAQSLPVPIPPRAILSDAVAMARSFAAVHRSIESVLRAALNVRQSIADALL